MNDLINKVAYFADDGTAMIEIAPHRTLNRCAFQNKQHVWRQPQAQLFVCVGCGQSVTEIPQR